MESLSLAISLRVPPHSIFEADEDSSTLVFVQLNGGATVINDGGTGNIVIPVTCNAAGTDFAYMGTDVTAILCTLT